MTLFDLSQGQSGKIIIKKVKELSLDLYLRLNHMGFIPGEIIELCSVSPLFKGSILVSVRGGRVALSQDEAMAISVEPC